MRKIWMKSYTHFTFQIKFNSLEKTKKCKIKKVFKKRFY